MSNGFGIGPSLSSATRLDIVKIGADEHTPFIFFCTPLFVSFEPVLGIDGVSCRLKCKVELGSYEGWFGYPPSGG